MNIVTESIVEDAALDWFRGLGYEVFGSADLAPNPGGLRKSYAEVVLDSPLIGALAKLNPALPDAALQDAQRKLERPAGATLMDRNRNFHRMLVDGVGVESSICVTPRRFWAQASSVEPGSTGRSLP